MAARSEDLELKIQSALNEFIRKREALAEELLKIKEATVKYVEEVFTKLESSLTSESAEIDDRIENSLVDLRRLIAKKKEVDQFMEKLSPVLNLAMGPSREVRKGLSTDPWSS